jgi:hypothetical protein
MSGNELGTKAKATKGKIKIDGLERSELRPKLLVPTLAQLARGERVIDMDPEVWPDSVRQMVKRSERAGWAWRVTHSEFLAVPPVTGADQGKWVHTHAAVVRMWCGLGRAWGCWLGTERQGWKFETGQYLGLFMSYPATVNSTELNGLITGTMSVKAVERTGEKPDEGSIRYAVEAVRS